MQRPGRLTLRRWNELDAETLSRAWHDPEIVAGSAPPRDRSVESAARWIGGVVERERRLLAFDRVIDLDGLCVGEVGVSNIDQRRRAALVGWWVMAEFRGQGIAKRALEMFVDDVLAPGHAANLVTLLAQISDENPASMRVAQQAGFRLLKEATATEPHVFVVHR